MLRYAPKPAAVVLAWLAALAALAWAISTSDPAARLLAAAGVGLLGTLALVATLARPRLAADDTGVLVGRLRGTRHWSWRDVLRVEAVPLRRLGRDTRLLELDVRDRDGTERLIVLTRLDLGEDPVEVAQALRALGNDAPR